MKPGGEEHAWILRRFLNIVHWTVAHHVIEEFLLVRASPVGAATEKRSEGKKDDVEKSWPEWHVVESKLHFVLTIPPTRQL